MGETKGGNLLDLRDFGIKEQSIPKKSMVKMKGDNR
jgi:hypothetical protein